MNFWLWFKFLKNQWSYLNLNRSVPYTWVIDDFILSQNENWRKSLTSFSKCYQVKLLIPTIPDEQLLDTNPVVGDNNNKLENCRTHWGCLNRAFDPYWKPWESLGQFSALWKRILKLKMVSDSLMIRRAGTEYQALDALITANYSFMSLLWCKSLSKSMKI